MRLQTLPDIQHNGYIIRVHEHVDKGNWAYNIYKVVQFAPGVLARTSDKWKRLRTIEHYMSPEAATEAGKNFINNHLTKKP